MIDAEQTYFQPAINHLVHLLQLKHNRIRPIIFHTYQCYLADSFQRVEKDIEKAWREGYYFAAKIVRGIACFIFSISRSLYFHMLLLLISSFLRLPTSFLEPQPF